MKHYTDEDVAALIAFCSIPNHAADGLVISPEDAARAWLDERTPAIAARALREFADTRGVNVGDEDDEWWKGYRQAQREALHDAARRADEIKAQP